MDIILWLVIGVAAAAAYIWYVSKKGRQEKSLLAYGLIIAALIYVGLAVFRGSSNWLFIEILGVAMYSVLAIAGLKKTAILIAIGWLLHPIWDILLHYNGPGHHIVPAWYAWACVSFDFLVAGYIWRRNWE